MNCVFLRAKLCLMNSLIYPPRLREGDRVLILSPSGKIDKSFLRGAVRRLQSWGLNPVLAPHAGGACGTYAGTVEQRLHDLQAALDDPQVRAILCSRGGYGAVHLVGHLDFTRFREYPKWLIGFSDISALHAAWLRAGVASLHSSMAKLLAEGGTADPCSRLMLDVLQGRFPRYSIPSHPLNRHGQATGMIVGGNLAVLSALVSTPYDILKPGRILFIEDINEEIYKVERMLYTLLLNGTLARLSGLIVGRFTGQHSPDRNGDTMEQMISRMVAPFGYPVAIGLPIGHIDGNVPIVEGSHTTLTVSASGTTLQLTTCTPANFSK